MATYNNIFQIKHNNVLPAQGSILISEPFLQEAYFQRSVVLLIEHNQQGSMGFILNKKTELIVNSFFKDLEEFPEMPIYLGGPVSPNRLFLYFDGDFETLKKYIQEGHSIEKRVKFFLGYSGWTEGQLINEIKENSWVVGNTTNYNILQGEGEELWKHSLEALGSQYEAWTKYPKEPCLN